MTRPDIKKFTFDMDETWFKLWRSIFTHKVFFHSSFRLLVYLVGNARIADQRDKSVNLKRGQFLTGKRALAIALKEPETTIYRNLRWLETEGIIVLEPDRDYTVVTICNYETYQGEENKSGPQVDRKWTASGPQVDLPKERKKERKKEISLYTEKELDDYAELLRNEYNRLTETTSHRKQTIENIKKRLKVIPVENLYFSISKYYSSVEDRDAEFRKICSNFFGDQEIYADFLPNTDDPEIAKNLTLLKTKIEEELAK